MALKKILQKQKAQKNQVASRIMYLLVNSKGTMGPKDQSPILIPPETLCHTPSLPETGSNFPRFPSAWCQVLGTLIPGRTRT